MYYIPLRTILMLQKKQARSSGLCTRTGSKGHSDGTITLQGYTFGGVCTAVYTIMCTLLYQTLLIGPKVDGRCCGTHCCIVDTDQGVVLPEPSFN